MYTQKMSVVVVGEHLFNSFQLDLRHCCKFLLSNSIVSIYFIKLSVDGHFGYYYDMQMKNKF